MFSADLQIKRILIESDSIIAVNLMNSTALACHPLAAIAGNCHVIIQHFDLYQIQHVHRERNLIADALVKDSICLPRGTTFLCSPPGHLSRMIFDDITGVGRFILINLKRSFGKIFFFSAINYIYIYGCLFETFETQQGARDIYGRARGMYLQIGNSSTTLYYISACLVSIVFQPHLIPTYIIIN